MHLTLFCNCLVVITWQLQNYLLPCFFKKWTGIDCPGCGFQRSVIALIKGDILQSFFLYPATLPVLLAAAITLADALKPDDLFRSVKRMVYIIAVTAILLSYAVKIGGYLH